MRKTVRSLAAALAFALPVLAPMAAPAEAPVPGPISVARTTGEALIIWDASQEVAGIVTNKIPDDQANEKLKHDALRIAAGNISKIEKTANTVTVRVIFNKTGPYSNVYKADTFGGVVRYATLEMPYKEASADKDHWKSLDAKSPLPGWMKFTILDKLPQPA